jgi:dTMP kinase
MTGHFITFEGIDGSGKTTISQEVYSRLRKKKREIILTREPTDTWRGAMVTKAIEENCNPLTIALLFMADRNEHVVQIRRWLEKKSIVLCDRYMDSTFAYQTVQLSQEMKNPLLWLQTIHHLFYLEPDLTFLFVIEPQKALQRINRKRSAFEKKDFLERVQKNYLALTNNDKRFIILDATLSIEELTKRCIDKINSIK